MPYCENCGNNVSDTAKFCSGCGEKINDISRTSEIRHEDIKNHKGAYSYYDRYDLDKYFGHLTKNFNLYLKRSIPENKLNSFISECRKKSTAYWEFNKPDDWNYFTPYMYFEDPDSTNSENGILLSAFDKKEGLSGTGEVMLIINQANCLYTIFISNIIENNIKQVGSKLIITDYEFDLFDDEESKEKKIQFAFKKCDPVLAALINFLDNFGDINNIEGDYIDLEDDEDQDKSLIKPKDGAGIR